MLFDRLIGSGDDNGWRHVRIVLEPLSSDFEPNELTAESERFETWSASDGCRSFPKDPSAAERIVDVAPAAPGNRIEAGVESRGKSQSIFVAGGQAAMASTRRQFRRHCAARERLSSSTRSAMCSSRVK